VDEAGNDWLGNFALPQALGSGISVYLFQPRGGYLRSLSLFQKFKAALLHPATGSRLAYW
jgi:hypothetical protein